MAAITSDNKPMIRNKSRAKAACPAAAQICKTLKIPKKAQFNKAPDKSAETGDGASMCASGSQVCMGASPILVPYPTKRKITLNFNQGMASEEALFKSTSKKTVSPLLAATARNNVPRRARAIPAEQINRYFQVASTLWGVR